MPPRTNDEVGRPWTYGLKLRTNAGSPEPVATRQLRAAALVAVGALPAVAVCSASTARPSIETKSAARIERGELRMSLSFLPASRGAGDTPSRDLFRERLQD